MNTNTIELADGAPMPAVGLGTYLMSEDQAEAAVGAAIDLGYRHVDTAAGYFNEAGVGRALAARLATGTTRDELFVTAKLWPGNAAWGEVPKTTRTTIEALDETLASLQLDHVDLYLIHAPFDADQRIAQWRGLVALQESGKARQIGVSNFNQNHVEEIRAAGLPLPAANQIELHPWSQKPDLVAYLQDLGITPIAYSSLVPLADWRTGEGQDSAKTDAMRIDGGSDRSPFRAMASKYGVSEAQVLLRWGVQRGFPVIPKTTNVDRMRTNLDLFSFEIDDEDMSAIATMDRGEGVAWAVGDPTLAL